MKKHVSAARRPRTHETLKSPSALLMAMEGRAMFEWASYALTWPWLRTAPRGDGHPVLALPGLCAGDNSTYPLRRFLDHLGYETYPWQQGLNFGPRDHVVKGLVDQVRRVQKDHGCRRTGAWRSLVYRDPHSFRLADLIAP